MLNPKYKAYIFGALRKCWRWTKERREVLNDSKVTGKVDKFRCSECNKTRERKFVHVDHVFPVVDPLKGFEGFDTYISRLYCDKTGLQILCSSCHSAKTKAENKLRRETKKKLKEKVWHWPYLRTSDGPEYECRHGVGHSEGVHGCEGCCSDSNFPRKKKVK